MQLVGRQRSGRREGPSIRPPVVRVEKSNPFDYHRCSGTLLDLVHHAGLCPRSTRLCAPNEAATFLVSALQLWAK
jgi:hypothetical protein